MKARSGGVRIVPRPAQGSVPDNRSYVNLGAKAGISVPEGYLTLLTLPAAAEQAPQPAR
jgi:hypothetical protein